MRAYKSAISGGFPFSRRIHSDVQCASRNKARSSRIRPISKKIRCDAQSSEAFLSWLEAKGVPKQHVTIATVNRGGMDVDLTVASEPLHAGDVCLRIPEEMIVTLENIFEDGGVAELLTTSKLSEIACLALYFCYEKKRGIESTIHPLIQELDRQAARGPQGARSPLLWPEEQIEELLAGSPVVDEIKSRLEGIRKEYEELDTVWFMTSSLFRDYPFEIPTEQFSFDVFCQAFVAISGSIVHLQGVELSKRFAVIPLGPPLLSYSSTSKATFKYKPEEKEVQLVVDREYLPGQPVYAWCGPQPNSKLLINYGVVDPGNPYDKMPFSVVIPSNDPLYILKRSRLSEMDLSTQQTFQLTEREPLPEDLIPYLRLTYARTEEDVWKVQFNEGKQPISKENEEMVLSAMIAYLQERMSAYRSSIEEDEAVIADIGSHPRSVVAAQLLRIEKMILLRTLNRITEMSKGYNIGIVSDMQGVVFQ